MSIGHAVFCKHDRVTVDCHTPTPLKDVLEEARHCAQLPAWTEISSGLCSDQIAMMAFITIISTLSPAILHGEACNVVEIMMYIYFGIHVHVSWL